MNSSNQKVDLHRLIGNTPLIPINIPSEAQATVYAKCESANLTGSAKDRIVLAILEDALHTGRITRDTLIVEGSSGNTGVSLAVIAGTLGLKVRIYMQEHRSQDRVKLMRYFGADVVLTSSSVAMSHVWDARAFAAEHSAEDVYLLNQHGSDINWRTHYSTTAVEILHDLGRAPDALICGIGTGGSLVGIGRRFLEVNANCELIAVEPNGFVTQIEGLLKVTDNPKLPEVYDPTLASLTISVTEEEAMSFTRILNREYAILSGISSGAVLCGVTKYLRIRPRARVVVCVFPDRIEKYFSTLLFDEAH